MARGSVTVLLGVGANWGRCARPPPPLFEAPCRRQWNLWAHHQLRVAVARCGPLNEGSQWPHSAVVIGPDSRVNVLVVGSNPTSPTKRQTDDGGEAHGGGGAAQPPPSGPECTSGRAVATVPRHQAPGLGCESIVIEELHIATGVLTQGGGGWISGAVNVVWEILRFKLAAKVPTQNPERSAIGTCGSAPPSLHTTTFLGVSANVTAQNRGASSKFPAAKLTTSDLTWHAPPPPRIATPRLQVEVRPRIAAPAFIVPK